MSGSSTPQQKLTRASSLGEASRPGENGPAPAPPTDFLQLAWQYRGLLVLGAIVGIGAGYLRHVRQPLTYCSSAQIRVVEPAARALPIRGLEADVKRGPLSDETLVVLSEDVLRRAVDLGLLDQDHSFSQLRPAAIATRLTNSVQVTHLGAKLSGTYRISYQAPDPDTSRAVVQAVLDAYTEHLRSRYTDVGREAVELIESARTEVLQRLEELENRLDELRQASPLVLAGAADVSIHRQNAETLLARKQRLTVQKMQLQTILRIAEQALSADEPLEAVWLALNRQPPAAAGTVASPGDQQGPAATITQAVRTRPSRAEELRELSLLPLQARYQELLEQFGTSHPSARSMKVEIDLVESRVQRLEAAEAAYAERVRQALADHHRPGEDAADVQGAIKRDLQLQLLGVRQQLKVVESELAAFGDAYQSEMKIAKSERQAEIQIARLEREIARQQSLYDRIVARLDEITVVSEAGACKLLTLQSPKLGQPSSPPLGRALLGGGALGALLAMFCGYLRERTRDAYRGAEEIAMHLGVPVMGQVPAFALPAEGSGAPAGHCYLPALHTPQCSTSESFKAARTSIWLANQGKPPRTILVTSPIQGDGKSTVAANLSIALAQSGKQVLLVDADLRRPRMHQLFAIDTDRGLSWLLERLPGMPKAATIKQHLPAVVSRTGVENLSVLPAGGQPANPSELLSSAQFDAVLAALGRQYDVVIIDSPPLLAVTDPGAVAARTDGVLLVIRIQRHAKSLAERAARMLNSLDANVIGTVINGVGSRQARGYRSDDYLSRRYRYPHGYGYGYQYGYARDSQPPSDLHPDGTGRSCPKCEIALG